MPSKARWIFTAAMDVDTDREALFNEVYDTEHVPHLRKVPGVLSVRRARLDTLRVTMGGETHTVDAGRWPGEVRPYTRNRQHTLHRLLDE